MTSVIESWAAAVKELTVTKRPFLIIEADDVGIRPADLTKVSSNLVAEGLEKPESVASVLLPMSVLRASGDLEERLLIGVLALSRWRAKSERAISGWSHTYFERLVGRYGRRPGKIESIGHDQLTQIIDKMNAWDKDVRAALYAHTNLPTDRLRIRGAPCLQYIQIEMHDGDKFTVNALYRSHDYGNKCLGNLIGLCRLGALISDETGRNFDRLRVISLHPFLPSGKTKILERLVDGLVLTP